MAYLINYFLSPVRAQGLNQALDITVEVRGSNGIPVIGKEVFLKLVKPTTNKIKGLKSNQDPQGFLNHILTSNRLEGCSWESIYQTEVIKEYEDLILDFEISLTGEPVVLLKESLYLRKDYKLVGVKEGQKVLISPNGNVVIQKEKEINLILQSLGNRIMKYPFTEPILDCCVDNKNQIYVLQEFQYTIIGKNSQTSFPLKEKFDRLYFYKDTGYFLKGTDCALFKNGVQVGGFSLGSDFIQSFLGDRNHLVYKTETKLNQFNLDTQEKIEIPLNFLTINPQTVKGNEETLYFTLDNCLFKALKKKEAPFIEFSLENDPILQSFSLETEGEGSLWVQGINKGKEKVYWRDQGSGSFSIPIEEKTEKVKVCWDGSGSRSFSFLGNFTVQGSLNFGQILEPSGLTDSKGQVKFTYIAREISKTESFMATVK